MRRALAHLAALGWRRVAGPHQRGHLDVRVAQRFQLGPDARQRRPQVALDVVRQRLQRRYVHDVGLVGERALDARAHQVIDRGEERGEGLSGPGRRRDQRVAACPDGRPRLQLGRRRARER